MEKISMSWAERLAELADLIAAGIMARKYAETEAEREQINALLSRAYAEKYKLMEGLSR